MRKLLIALTFTALITSISVQPVYAANEGFFQRFSSFSERLRDRWERFTLSLPGEKSGEAVMRQSLRASQNIRSAEVSTTSTVDLFNDTTKLTNLKIETNGAAEGLSSSDPAMYKQNWMIKAEGTMDGTTLRTNANVVVASKTVYFMFNELPILPLKSVDISTLKGQWMKVTLPEDAQNNSGVLIGQPLRLKEDMNRFVGRAKFGQAKKEMKDGRAVFVVEGTLPKEVLKEAAFPSQAMDNVDDLTVTFWIDRSSYYITHLEIPFTEKFERKEVSAENAKLLAPLNKLAQTNMVQILITIDLKNFNQPVTVTEPIDAREAQTVFAEVLGSMGQEGSMFSEGSSELPVLTPQQRLELQRYEQLQQQQQVLEKKMERLEQKMER